MGPPDEFDREIWAQLIVVSAFPQESVILVHVHEKVLVCKLVQQTNGALQKVQMYLRVARDV